MNALISAKLMNILILYNLNVINAFIHVLNAQAKKYVHLV